MSRLLEETQIIGGTLPDIIDLPVVEDGKEHIIAALRKKIAEQVDKIECLKRRNFSRPIVVEIV